MVRAARPTWSNERIWLLACYAPSPPADFAGWARIGVTDARASVEALGAEVVEVAFAGAGGSAGSAVALAADLALLESSPPVQGVRLLPGNDPFLLLRDRQTLAPDKAVRQRVWRPVGNPGVVLSDGRLVGMWRSRKKGSTVELTVEGLESLPTGVRARVEAEAAVLARLRGCSAAAVTYTGDVSRRVSAERSRRGVS